MACSWRAIVSHASSRCQISNMLDTCQNYFNPIGLCDLWNDPDEIFGLWSPLSPNAQVAYTFSIGATSAVSEPKNGFMGVVVYLPSEPSSDYLNVTYYQAGLGVWDSLVTSFSSYMGTNDDIDDFGMSMDFLHMSRPAFGCYDNIRFHVYYNRQSFQNRVERRQLASHLIICHLLRTQQSLPLYISCGIARGSLMSSWCDLPRIVIQWRMQSFRAQPKGTPSLADSGEPHVDAGYTLFQVRQGEEGDNYEGIAGISCHIRVIYHIPTPAIGIQELISRPKNTGSFRVAPNSVEPLCNLNSREEVLVPARRVTVPLEGLGKRDLVEKEGRTVVMPIRGQWIPLIMHQVMIGPHLNIHGVFYRVQNTRRTFSVKTWKGRNGSVAFPSVHYKMRGAKATREGFKKTIIGYQEKNGTTLFTICGQWLELNTGIK
ncbi:hypothetical protein V8B97DRAFT_1914260 [Scleroderma yunnanense]